MGEASEVEVERLGGVKIEDGLTRVSGLGYRFPMCQLLHWRPSARFELLDGVRMYTD